MALASMIYVVPKVQGGGKFRIGEAIIHRNLKPRCLFVVYEGVVRQCKLKEQPSSNKSLRIGQFIDHDTPKFMPRKTIARAAKIMDEADAKDESFTSKLRTAATRKVTEAINPRHKIQPGFSKLGVVSSDTESDRRSDLQDELRDDIIEDDDE